MWLTLIFICTLTSAAAAVFWMQRDNHSREISLLGSTHADEISRLQQKHSTEVSRLQTTHAEEVSRLRQDHSNVVCGLEAAHAKAISLLQGMAEKLVESAYRSGRASARPHVFKGQEHTGRWLWKMTRELAIAVVLDEQGSVLAFAGDGSKLDSIEMPPEIKKMLAGLSGPAGKAIANLVI